MSVDTAPPATSAPIFRPAASEPSALTQFRRILAAEWTKLRSVRSTRYTLAVNALVCVGLGVLFCYGVVSRWDQQSPAERASFDPASFSLNGLFLGQLIIGALGVLVISAEYSTGTIRATLGAIPQRRTVLAGKAVVFAGVALAVSLITCFAAFFLGQLVLHGKGIDTTLGQPGVLRVVLGGALFLTAVGLLGLGLGTLLRNTAAGISAVVGLLFVLPILANFLPSDIRVHVTKFLPGTAGMGIWSVHREANTLSPWVGFGLLCAYALATLVAGSVVLARRDA
jgi:ABC-2 type transport system permease protein